MAMYQFLIAVRSGPGGGQMASMLTNEAGEVTSHIQGMFNRTIKLMSSGIRPVYVFDGKPPQLKGGELAKRLARRAKAEADLAQAKEAGELEDMDRFARRLVKVTRQHNEDCKDLLKLMGVPVLTAPCEAEAQCAELARKTKVYGTATEDMDALTFRSPKLIRKLTFSQSSAKDKQPILEIDFESVIRGLDLSYEQFVDLCILCGCDYCSTIKGIGPKNALKLIRQYKSLEEIIKHVRKEKKYSIPPEWFPQKVLKADMDALRAYEKELEQKALEAKNASLLAPETVLDKGKESIKEEIKDEIKEEIKEEEMKQEETLPIDQIVSEVAEAKEAAGLGDEEDDLFIPPVDDEEVLDEDVEAPVDESNAQNDESPEEIDLDNFDYEKYELIPPLYVQARQLFINCDVTPGESVELKWNEPDEDGLKEFLVSKMGFNPDRVSSGIKKLKEAQQQKAQKRLDR